MFKVSVEKINKCSNRLSKTVSLIFSCLCLCVAGEGRSELDELQEEVARRAKEQELQRRKEKEKEAAMGFNPRPSKFMDLDELQNQGEASACHARAKGVALSPDAFPWVSAVAYPLELGTACVRVCEAQVCWFPC